MEKFRHRQKRSVRTFSAARAASADKDKPTASAPASADSALLEETSPAAAPEKKETVLPSAAAETQTPSPPALGDTRSVRIAAAFQGNRSAPNTASRFDNEGFDLEFRGGLTLPDDEPEPEPAPVKTIPLEQLRRQRRRRKTRKTLLITVLLAAVLVWLTTTYGSNLAVLGDVVDGISASFASGGGFPVKTGITQIRQLLPLGNGFVELGEDDLVVYSGDGALLRSIQPSYGRPAITAGNSRFCLYNRAGTELRVESRSKNLYTFTAEDSILLCEMSANGTLAVVTRSNRYAALLSVYDTGMEEFYRWGISSEEGMPVSVAFASDNHRIAVGCLAAENGALCTHIYFLDTHKDAVQAQYRTDGAVVRTAWLSSDRLLVVLEDHAELLDGSGQLLRSMEFGGLNLQGISVRGENVALLLSSLAGGQMTVLNNEFETLASFVLNEPPIAVTLTQSEAYVVYNSAVQAFELGKQPQSLWRREYSSRTWAVLQCKHTLLFTENRVEILSEQPAETSAPAASAVPDAAASDSAAASPAASAASAASLAASDE